MKKKCQNLLIVSMTVFFTFGLNACIEYPKPWSQVIEISWDISLPKNMTMEFHTQTESFNGDGVRYTVFYLIEDSADFLEDFSRESIGSVETKIDQIIDGTYQINQIAESLGIPENFLPNWNAEYFWKYIGKNYREPYGYNDELYIIYFTDSKSFIFCEHFT